ncbi:diguanylate cyclase/phosphodiesterase (GGDEF & EAL domains) with PAS/PAC sensor(s) [hydrothermal vent metagenome]|uniref:Diguanylate cyclase/phosphodiesterase (GGDEF & EAL domains) with PAS/PAC sensor(S) n=1 Tax=hydrothermal vent metagenome TaxID=652676 RepID=A0A3B0ZR65_9ZZZZ
MKVGLSHLSGRYIWVAGFISVTLLVITVYAQNLVTRTAKDGYSVIRENTQLLQQVASVKQQIQQIERNVLKYTTYLDDETKFNIESDLHQLQIELLTLVQFVHQPGRYKISEQTKNNNTALSVLIDEIVKLENKPAYAEIGSHVNSLIVTIKDLERHTHEYLNVMSNVRTRYPGMPHLLEFLMPNNALFSEAVESALQESAMTDAQMGDLDRNQYKIFGLFQSIRYAWAQKVSWLRIAIANRMGAFGDPVASMDRNLKNRQIYAEIVEYRFEDLDKLNKKGLLGLQQEESLEVMHQASELYEAHFNKAISVYVSDNWRSDLPMLKNILNPNFELLRKTVASIEGLINQDANKGLKKSLLTADLLSGFIWLFTVTLILLLAFSYFIFKRVIRDPVLKVAKAMEAEARGESYKLNAKNSLDEIKLLDKAFNDMRDQVRSRQQRLEAVFSNAAEGILTIDVDCKIESINEAGLRLFGLTQKTSKNKCLSDLIYKYEDTELYQLFHQDDFSDIHFEGEFQAINTKREIFPLSIKVSQMQLGAEVLYILIVQDISEQKALVSSLQHIAEHDALTGLYNRQYYSDNLDLIIERAHEDQSFNIVCMYLDLDNFKYINDTLGHMAGDRLLKEVTGLLHNRMRKSDLLARIGGDEFSLVFLDIELDKAANLANEYRQCIKNYKFIENGKAFNVGCSIGLAAMAASMKNKDELLSRADVACHEAKRKGKNCIHIYDDTDQRAVDSLYVDMGWSQRIKNAIKNDNFVFAKQKIVSTTSNEVFAEEYLIRMVDDEKQGLIMPAGFLGAAERFDLMPEVDRWVVRNALQTYSLGAKSTGEADMHCISINLSAKSVGHPEIFYVIRESIEEFAINPAKIIFEITEDVAISDFPNAIIFLNKLRAMGCATALDDFGAGYSSFSYLKEFPVDYVKIDGSFIVGIENNKLNYALVKAMHDVCTILHKKTVVEFVENQQALDVLKQIGVDYVQGFFIAKPELIETNQCDTSS